MEPIAVCVGLWLAEGDSKTTRELTFTNSQPELVIYFHHNTNYLVSKYNSRIYAYAKESTHIINPIPTIENFKKYVDYRANRPYFILRTASVELVIQWKNTVEKFYTKKYAREIMQGLFAGEGSVKTSSHNSRVLRLAQKGRNAKFENLFEHLGLKYKYIEQNRTYEFTGKKNWDLFAKLRLADLHPLKREKFWKVYNNYKQAHYAKKYIYNRITNHLKKPQKIIYLAELFSRSPARIYDVLSELKKEGKVKHIRINGDAYWINIRLDLRKL